MLCWIRPVLAKKMNVVHGRRFLIRSGRWNYRRYRRVCSARMGIVDGAERNVRLSVSLEMRLPILMAILRLHHAGEYECVRR